MRILSSVFALALLACSPEPAAPIPSMTAPPPVTAKADQTPSRDDIRGEWRLVTLNGQSAPALWGGDPTPPILLSVGDFTLRARSQCVAFWRRYERRDDAIVVTPANPGAMCARGLSDWERSFDKALSAVTDARVNAGRLRLTGPGVDLLFEPAPPLPTQSLAGTWRVRDWHGQRPPAEAQTLTVEITRDEIRPSACVFSGWRYRQDGPLLEVTPKRGAVCERTLTPWETQFGAFMDKVHQATMLPDGVLVLDSPGTQVAFTRVD